MTQHSFSQQVQRRLAVLLAVMAIVVPVSAFADCEDYSCRYVPVGQTVQVQPQFGGASPSCLNINNNCGMEIMVPTQFQGEWASFVNAVYNGSYNNYHNCVGLSDCSSAPVVAAAAGVYSTHCGGNGFEYADNQYTADLNQAWMWTNPNCTGTAGSNPSSSAGSTTTEVGGDGGNGGSSDGSGGNSSGDGGGGGNGGSSGGGSGGTGGGDSGGDG